MKRYIKSANEIYIPKSEVKEDFLDFVFNYTDCFKRLGGKKSKLKVSVLDNPVSDGETITYIVRCDYNGTTTEAKEIYYIEDETHYTPRENIYDDSDEQFFMCCDILGIEPDKAEDKLDEEVALEYDEHKRIFIEQDKELFSHEEYFAGPYSWDDITNLDLSFNGVKNTFLDILNQEIVEENLDLDISKVKISNFHSWMIPNNEVEVTIDDCSYDGIPIETASLRISYLIDISSSHLAPPFNVIETGSHFYMARAINSILEEAGYK